MIERAAAPPDTGGRLAFVLLGWLGGIAAQLQLRDAWPEAGALACTIVGGVALVAGGRFRRAWPLAVAGAAALALGLAGLQAAAGRADRLAPSLEGRDLQVVGVVASLPQRGPDGLRFRFEPESARLDGRDVRLPAALALGWYRGRHDEAAAFQPLQELRAGQRWQLTLRLKRPHGSVNPHGFDYELLLFEQGSGATGYVRDAPRPRLLDLAAGHPVERLRQRVRDAIEAHVADRRAAGVLAALAVGDQSAIERRDWDLYRNAGIAHLVSISGLHITMFAWLAGGLIARGWRRSPRLALAWPTPLAARWGGAGCAAAYAVFSGWGVPSQRTVWMLLTVTLLRTIGVRWPWPLVLLVAAVVVTAVDPWALMQAGFWLSFVAVGLLMASSPAGRVGKTMDADAKASGHEAQALGHDAPEPGRTAPTLGRHASALDRGAQAPGVDPKAPLWRRGLAKAGATVRADLRTQVIATIGLTPLTLVFFQQVSVVGFAANLIAIPLITLVITPLALLGIALPLLWPLGASVVGGLNAVLGGLAGWPGAVWQVPVAPPWAQAAGLLGALLIVAPLPWRARLLALPLVLPLLLPAPPRPPAGRFDLLALDVGQGTSVVVRTREHLLVFDAGPRYATDSDAGDRVLLPLLRARGETRIDRLVLSHRDLDHVGGAAALIAGLPVDELLSSLEDGHPLRDLVRNAVRCRDGQAWTWDGVRFEMLRPEAEDYDRALKSNAMSCVLRVDDGRRSVLLTGDIEREQEAALVGRARERLRSDVLIVPHHGSKTSSTGTFLDAVAPRIAVFQAGYRNRFGHPAPDVLQRYVERGIALRSSPSCGAWWLAAEGPDDGVCWRDATRRYWRFGETPDREPP